MNVDYQNSDSISNALEFAQGLLNRLSAEAQAGVHLTPKQYRLLSEMVPSLNRLRAVHVKDCTINNRKTASELTKMWNVDKDWVGQFKAIHVPHKRVRYLGAVVTIYAGTNYLAYDSKGILWAFGIEPKIIDGVWQSRGDSYEISPIRLPREDWENSLRAVDDLQES